MQTYRPSNLYRSVTIIVLAIVKTLVPTRIPARIKIIVSAQNTAYFQKPST